MATSSKKSSNNIPSITFHKRTFGTNINLDSDGFRATRENSFDNGITFSNAPIKLNEKVYLKVIDTDDTRQWLGSLAIGFTQLDPNSIPRNDLNRSALPNLSKQTGTSYIKRISDVLTKNCIITLYFNQNGAFYILDGKEHELFTSIDWKKSLWAVIDIYGNVKSMEFTTAPSKLSSVKEFFAKFPEKPDRLSIKHFTDLQPKDLQPVSFCSTHGPEVDIYCLGKVVLRKNIHQLVRPYVFIDLAMFPGDELYLRILSVDSNFRMPGVFGFTNAQIPRSAQALENLCANDPAGLVDRCEFWIIGENVLDEKLKELDELCISIDRLGEIYLQKNDRSATSKKLIAFSDPQIGFHPFLFLNGRINALSIMGLKSNRILEPTPLPLPTPQPKDDEEGLCQICWTDKANCVLVPCGHIFFCVDCKDNYENSTHSTICPVCRTQYADAIEIADD